MTNTARTPVPNKQQGEGPHYHGRTIICRWRVMHWLDQAVDWFEPQQPSSSNIHAIVWQAGFMGRLVITLLMACSCALIPSHWVYPGDDVVQFHLRTTTRNQPQRSHGNGVSDASPFCFAERGTFCDCGLTCTWKDGLDREDSDGDSPSFWIPRRRHCDDDEQNEKENYLQTTIYPFFLTPLTRWDSARFLRLALRPQLRVPNRESDTATDTQQQQQPDAFMESEMAHAFFPLYPYCIQLVALCLLWLFPPFILPITCEGVLVLSAWVLNTCCFCVALYSLYQFTHALAIPKNESPRVARQWATRVSLLFAMNPAAVFFVAAYSESLFAALVFTGTWMIWESRQHHAPPMKKNLLWWLGATLWTVACSSRSNGIVYAGFFLLYGLGRIIQPFLSWYAVWGRILCYTLAMVVLALPLVWHNTVAVAAHCSNHIADDDEAVPDWCRSEFFYLYPYIQAKYWNVGWFRYYQWKQVPNFLLATPIHVLSGAAAWAWIVTSWKRTFVDLTKKNDDDPDWRRHSSSTSWCWSVPRKLVLWTVTALRAAAADPPPPTTFHVSSRSPNDKDRSSSSSMMLSLPRHCSLSEDVLALYAVLAVSALLTLTTAHVQIATRLLCSSCPVLYWYMDRLVDDMSSSQRLRDGKDDNNNQKTPEIRLVWWPMNWGELLVGYCILYNVLGIVMHPNWLPWT